MNNLKLLSFEQRNSVRRFADQSEEPLAVTMDDGENLINRSNLQPRRTVLRFAFDIKKLDAPDLHDFLPLSPSWCSCVEYSFIVHSVVDLACRWILIEVDLKIAERALKSVRRILRKSGDLIPDFELAVRDYQF